MSFQKCHTEENWEVFTLKMTALNNFRFNWNIVFQSRLCSIKNKNDAYYDLSFEFLSLHFWKYFQNWKCVKCFNFITRIFYVLYNTFLAIWFLDVSDFARTFKHLVRIYIRRFKRIASGLHACARSIAYLEEFLFEFATIVIAFFFITSHRHHFVIFFHRVRRSIVAILKQFNTKKGTMLEKN